MILTQDGYLQFRAAGELIRADAPPLFAWFKDGHRYRITAAALVGANKVRLTGRRAENGDRHRNAPHATITAAANEVIPVIVAPETP